VTSKVRVAVPAVTVSRKVPVPRLAGTVATISVDVYEITVSFEPSSCTVVAEARPVPVIVIWLVSLLITALRMLGAAAALLAVRSDMRIASLEKFIARKRSITVPLHSEIVTTS
jgi:hypothetical protein